jgi:predicted kinase
MEQVRSGNFHTTNPTLFLVRGVPGAGKSTFANHIWNSYAICEADKFFYDKEGNYNFDPTKLREAHDWCRNEVNIRMEDHKVNNQYYPEIVVSNTFTQEWEMELYYDMAKKYGYQVVSIIIENRHGGKNTHGCPEDKVQAMRDRFQISL